MSKIGVMVYKKAQINHERFQNPKIIQQTDSVLKNKKNMHRQKYDKNNYYFDSH